MAGKPEGRSVVAAAGFAATTKRAPSGLLGSLALTRTPTYGTPSGPRADPGPHLGNPFRSPRSPGLKSARQPRGGRAGGETAPSKAPPPQRPLDPLPSISPAASGACDPSRKPKSVGRRTKMPAAARCRGTEAETLPPR
ncbi:uncharacterized protein LOC144577813 [Callithrix jacchus]